jgi:Mn-dependent DtxR family transcriptional regulator
VSITLGQLAKRGLVRFDAARFPQLTAAGHRVAAGVRGRFTIVLALLTDILGVSPERARAEACRWEHVISHEVADRILDLVRFGSEDAEFTRTLREFHRFHRQCGAGTQCSSCAVHGPVESFCPEREPVPFPPNKSA